MCYEDAPAWEFSTWLPAVSYRGAWKHYIPTKCWISYEKTLAPLMMQKKKVLQKLIEKRKNVSIILTLNRYVYSISFSQFILRNNQWTFVSKFASGLVQNIYSGINKTSPSRWLITLSSYYHVVGGHHTVLLYQVERDNITFQCPLCISRLNDYSSCSGDHTAFPKSGIIRGMQSFECISKHTMRVVPRIITW